MTTLRRSLFTLVTTARLALLLAQAPKAGLLLVSPVRVRFTPLRLVPAPGLTVMWTIGLGNPTDLRTMGRPLLYRAPLAAAPPRLTVVVTLLVHIILRLPWVPVRTRMTWLRCLPELPSEPHMALLVPMTLEHIWKKVSPFIKGLAVTPKVRVVKGLLLEER